jgi:hypothetical protein
MPRMREPDCQGALLRGAHGGGSINWFNQSLSIIIYQSSSINCWVDELSAGARLPGGVAAGGARRGGSGPPRPQSCSTLYRCFIYRTATMDSNFRHFERAAEGRRDQIRISHFERDFGEFGDSFAQDSNGPAVRTNLWDGLQQGARGQQLDCCVLAWS